MDIAVENKATDAVEKDMRSVVKTISDSKELKDMLASPVIKGRDQKESALKVFLKDVHTITEGTDLNVGGQQKNRDVERGGLKIHHSK